MGEACHLATAQPWLTQARTVGAEIAGKDVTGKGSRSLKQLPGCALVTLQTATNARDTTSGRCRP